MRDSSAHKLQSIDQAFRAKPSMFNEEEVDGLSFRDLPRHPAEAEPRSRLEKLREKQARL